MKPGFITASLQNGSPIARRTSLIRRLNKERWLARARLGRIPRRFITVAVAKGVGFERETARKHLLGTQRGVDRRCGGAILGRKQAKVDCAGKRSPRGWVMTEANVIAVGDGANDLGIAGAAARAMRGGRCTSPQSLLIAISGSNFWRPEERCSMSQGYTKDEIVKLISRGAWACPHTARGFCNHF